MSIKPIAEDSWPAISTIEEQAYTAISPESEEVLKSKWQASPTTCAVYTNNENKIIGYILAHPWGNRSLPKLHQKTPISGESTNLFLHDLAVAKRARGTGIANALVEDLLNKAIKFKFKKVTLIAVQGADIFWGKYGFKEVPGAQISSHYGVDAKLMKIDL